MAHCLNLITKDFIKHTFATRILNWSNMITTYFKKSHLPQSLLEDKIKEKSIKGGGLKTYVSTRWVTAFEMLQSIFRLEICLKEVITENPRIITNKSVQNIIMHKRGFFQDVQDLAMIIKPIKESIILLENQEANLADCFFLLAKLGAVIKNIPETDIEASVGIVEGQFVRISTTAAALWQQMLRIPEILTMVKRNKHSKRKSGEILIAQLRDYHTRQSPYNASYIYNIDTPIRWWQTCEMKPPYLQYLATKMFSVSPHAANCERIWSVCGWIHGTRRTKILVKNLDAIAQIHSYYIFNNKSELSHYGVEKSEEEIQQILRDADLYEEEEEITLEEIMTEINLEQTAIDDDLEAINDEPLELEEALNLSNSRFLHDASTPYMECDENDDSVDYTNLLMEYDEEGDYNPEELAKMFERFNV
ncbi:hypothetical protein RhiirC2_856073 [Rhizophagus irregularis]|uniref:HAT C-terminal dimerisation domain-containing protein n=1 Tax=Rhizophagus irregularis TaxID=588596 RepID=A0A2N1MJE0_9GLOM|nr:hypothetical protein RhiirC2_856073 [Rhizophagus irregularis]